MKPQILHLGPRLIRNLHLRRNRSPRRQVRDRGRWLSLLDRQSYRPITLSLDLYIGDTKQ